MVQPRRREPGVSPEILIALKPDKAVLTQFDYYASLSRPRKIGSAWRRGGNQDTNTATFRTPIRYRRCKKSCNMFPGRRDN